MKKTGMAKACGGGDVCGATLMCSACSNGVDWRSGADCGGANSGDREPGDAGGDVVGNNVSAADLQTVQSAGAQAGADLQ